ncbi:MFS transporter [Cobetia sp. QF-1]|uniref:MFS transporter n=1 Tax=Cobetia sp. QF-1 TaxID=1969833 RepID=UPI000B5447AA|nr:MFS transporter [Cobetia sp. QF-1]
MQDPSPVSASASASASSSAAQSRFFERMTGDEDSRICKDISEDACHQQSGNFMRHLLASLGTKLADELASARLVLPWLLGLIGAPIWMVGLLVPIREAGALLPQLLVAGFIRPLPQRKWVWAAGATLQALMALGLVILTLLAEGDSPSRHGLDGTLAGSLMLVLLAILSLGRGVASIATKDVLGKTIAKQRRGRLMGWSGSVAGAMTLIAGGSLMLMGQQPGQQVLAILMTIAALGWTLNAVCAALIQEDSGATGGGANAWDTVREGFSLLKHDAAFRNFNLARALLLSSALALPYIALLGQKQSGESLGGLGVLVVVSGLAGMVASPIWGKLADTSSRRVMRNAGAGAAACCAVAGSMMWWPDTLSNNVWSYALVYGALVVAHSGIRLGRKTYVVDLASADNRALYVALSNTLTGVLMLVLGLMIGGLAQWLGSEWLLLILAGVAACAALYAQRLPEVEDD